SEDAAARKKHRCPEYGTDPPALRRGKGGMGRDSRRESAGLPEGDWDRVSTARGEAAHLRSRDGENAPAPGRCARRPSRATPKSRFRPLPELVSRVRTSRGNGAALASRYAGARNEQLATPT